MAHWLLDALALGLHAMDYSGGLVVHDRRHDALLVAKMSPGRTASEGPAARTTPGMPMIGAAMLGSL